MRHAAANRSFQTGGTLLVAWVERGDARIEPPAQGGKRFRLLLDQRALACQLGP
jgi:hypothetical protein